MIHVFGFQWCYLFREKSVNVGKCQKCREKCREMSGKVGKSREMSGIVGLCQEMLGNQNYENNRYFHIGKFSHFETIFRRITSLERSGNAIKCW